LLFLKMDYKALSTAANKVLLNRYAGTAVCVSRYTGLD
jgi:hypothetical protein